MARKFMLFSLYSWHFLSTFTLRRELASVIFPPTIRCGQTTYKEPKVLIWVQPSFISGSRQERVGYKYDLKKINVDWLCFIYLIIPIQ
jgi:hypothetical protein